MEYLGNTYFTLKNLVIKAERRILKELGFCVHVQHPHKVVITFLQVLDCEKNQPLAQLAWNFMNDALRTNVFVRYQPGTIACACIFLSARQLKIPLPSRPPWWGLFDGKSEDIEDVCLTLLQLYQRPKVSLQTLNKAVDRLKKTLPTKKMNETFSTDAIEDKSKKRSSESTFSQPDNFSRQEEKSQKAMRERVKGSPSNVSPITEGTKSRSEDGKKNGSNKRESQGSKGTKKSSKSQQTRKDNKNPKPSSRSRSPLSEKSDSASATESDPGDSSDSDSASADSGSSNEDSRKRKEKITRRSRGQVDDRQREKHDDIRSTTGRKLYKSKSDTNSYRRARDRSRSPYRRSRSRSRERRNPREKPGRREDRNGDYKITDKYEKRDRSGRR